MDAVQASKVVSARTSSKLIHKLEALCSDYEGTQLQRQVYVDGRPKSDSHTLLYSIDALHSAINAGRMVRFRYKDGGTRTGSWHGKTAATTLSLIRTRKSLRASATTAWTACLP